MAKGKEFKHFQPKSGKRFKIPNLEQPTDYGKLKPSFSLKHMVYQGRCCISNCQREEKAHILETIQRLSQATWDEIMGWKREMGFEHLPYHRFNVPLPKIFTPEETILVVRYSGPGRIAGFREKDVYHIVLVGTDLYPH